MRGRVKAVINDIDGFFAKHPDIPYSIFVTRWCRDAVAAVRRFLLDTAAQHADEIVRVHAMGGTGTLFEVVNGVMGLPNAQVAAHPFGHTNTFLRFFGHAGGRHFHSMNSQVFSGTTPMDAMLCGRNYGMSYTLVGLEAEAHASAEELIERGIPIDVSRHFRAAVHILERKYLGQPFDITLDGTNLSGHYISIFIANAPNYGHSLTPAPEARPNDGVFDMYMVKYALKHTLLDAMNQYVHGHYQKVPQLVSHHQGQVLKISSPQLMRLNTDGEAYASYTMNYSILPNAIQFVAPSGANGTQHQTRGDALRG